MLLTLKYFFRSIFISTVTVEYPEKFHKMKFYNRFRARLDLISDISNSSHKCTGCKVCEKICPNKSIYIFSHKGISKRIELRNFMRENIYRFVWAYLFTHFTSSTFVR
jgi:formate hydrogenlyase subunit 6/NADH:ubiquinone oxidoreductase subunit I